MLRVSLLGEWIWPLYHRRPLETWVERWLHPVDLSAQLPDSRVHWKRTRNQRRTQNRNLQAQVIAKVHFHDAQMSRLAQRNLRALIDELRAASARVVLVRLPVRDLYLRVARAGPAGAALLHDVDEFVRSLATPDVLLAECRTVRDCGLTQAALADYGHMQRKGARKFTRWLLRQIARRPEG